MSVSDPAVAADPFFGRVPSLHTPTGAGTGAGAGTGQEGTIDDEPLSGPPSIGRRARFAPKSTGVLIESSSVSLPLSQSLVMLVPHDDDNFIREHAV